MDEDVRPPRFAVLLTGGAVTVATLALSLVPEAGVLALVGGVLAVAGTARGSRRVLGLGTLLELAGGVLAGAASLPAGLVLVGIVGAVLGWDIGEQSINAAQQLGSDAVVVRSVVVHAAASTLVGAVSIGLVYTTYLVATGGQPLAVLAAFLVGGGLVLLAMRA
ncbi:hypothetical protein HLRTI_002199 [Halorhabdus tiamatea SARL4B]|uniref:Uncharacterized protein n=2 Tax=Halorhabdus tiamatea SARL4B TaxID=1033806 RepID=U2E1C5_9EURY|nr:hypothetical protein [Halorhabdus tiamatea]ERJ05806.1 hypothetical protein HLRTI_002199 [Halorhabdus tiamatea SARL4B]